MMKYKNLLITGGAGFIGSNLAVHLRSKYPKLKVVVLDNLVRKGSELNLPRLKDSRVKFIRGDIRNPKDLALGNDIDLMIECSAEPSILAGYQNPKYVIDVNLVGTVNCLEFCRKRKADIIFLSTSRVYPYGEVNEIERRELATRFNWLGFEGISERFPISGPKTLYGATKLASEMLIQEYINDFGIRGVINRCGVVAGPWQFGKVDQGIFTYWMHAHYFKRPLKYIGFGGKGKQVRDILHIDDLFNLINLEINSLSKINGSIYNVGGGRFASLSLLETTKFCEEITGNRLKIGSDLKNRPGDIAIYISDNTKISHDVGWKPRKKAKETLIDIYNWIKNNEAQLKNLA